jgi:hypothetical protein
MTIAELMLASSTVALLAATPTGAACSPDQETGLPLPASTRGACVSSLDDATVFVQRSDEGLLIAWPAEGAISSVVFCPSALLDFTTGAPGPGCLAATHPLRPGAGAFAGTGTVRVAPNDAASTFARCPAAARVAASVTSPAGGAFELTGSIVALDEPGSTETCTSAYDRIELSFGGSHAPAIDPVVPRGPEQRERMKRLMELDRDQWRVVDLLLAVTPQDWQLLEGVVQTGRGVVLDPGTGAPGDGPGTPAGLVDVVNSILDRVNAVRTSLTSVSGRIPDRADVRATLAQIDLAKLRDMLRDVGDTLQGLVDIARDLREGFDTFDVAAFRARLGVVLTDLERASGITQRLLCADNPDITIREISMAPVRRLLDFAPPVVLYGLSRLLETLDSEWDQRLGSALENIPAEVLGLCGPRALAPDLEAVVCLALRPKEVGTRIKVAKVASAAFLMFVRYAKNNTKEDIDATVGATAVAGATAGTSVKNPADTALDIWVDRLERLKDGIKDLIDRRKDCLDGDHDVESDLRDCAKDGCSCSVPLTVLLDGAVQPSYKYVSDVLGNRILLAENAGLANVSEAHAKFLEAIDGDHEGTAAGYGLLCEAYKLLLPSTGTPGGGRIPRRP